MIKTFIFVLLLLSYSVHSEKLTSPPSTQEVKENIIRIVDSYSENFSGIITVSHNTSPLFNIPRGFADIQKDAKFSELTVIDIGSITKQFTAAAILKLEDLGQLTTDDLASKYLPELTGKLRATSIHQLLTHTSGITGETGDDYATFTSQDLLQHLNQVQLTYLPGTYHYSNLGYSLLTLIVERLSKQSLEAFLNHHFFTPLKMTSTGYRLPPRQNEKISQGYFDDEIWGYPHQKNWDSDGPYWNLRGNGGMLSSANDMLTWMVALHHSNILSKQSKQKLFTPHVREFDGVESYYGYGWVIETLANNQQVIWHNGGNGIFSADIRYYPSSGYFYFIAGNRSETEVYDLSDKIHHYISSL